MRRINAHMLEPGDVLVIDSGINAGTYDVHDIREMPDYANHSDGLLYVYVDVDQSAANPFVFGIDEVITIL